MKDLVLLAQQEIIFSRATKISKKTKKKQFFAFSAQKSFKVFISSGWSEYAGSHFTFRIFTLTANFVQFSPYRFWHPTLEFSLEFTRFVLGCSNLGCISRPKPSLMFSLYKSFPTPSQPQTSTPWSPMHSYTYMSLYSNTIGSPLSRGIAPE